MSAADDLAADIRLVDGRHVLGAGRLGEKLAERGWRKIPDRGELADRLTRLEVRGKPQNGLLQVSAESFADAIIKLLNE